MKPPIVIFQMGRVGSSTIEISLLSSGFRPIKMHTIKFGLLDGIPSQRSFIPRQVKKLARLKDIMNNGRRYNLITCVREPVDRALSAFYHHLGHYKTRAKRNGRNTERLINVFLEEFNHDWGLNWFDNHMLPSFGIDIYDEIFPKIKGYMIRDVGVIKLLIIRTEDIDRVWGPLFREFFGIKLRYSGRRNEGSKNHAKTYSEFRKNVKLPSWFLDKMYNSKLAKHFYTTDEIARFRKPHQ